MPSNRSNSPANRRRKESRTAANREDPPVVASVGLLAAVREVPAASEAPTPAAAQARAAASEAPAAPTPQGLEGLQEASAAPNPEASAGLALAQALAAPRVLVPHLAPPPAGPTATLKPPPSHQALLHHKTPPQTPLHSLPVTFLYLFSPATLLTSSMHVSQCFITFFPPESPYSSPLPYYYAYLAKN
ncbi:hypothetical protein E2C01_099661 [Portunus trituberculatus]|uniref:Uncharacterized protein n=1 Tax=Portunus trituberculatus TaxID=210409 RepID=A0A5B7KB10_PORTR|nr:hypothetical protein [Portunus trituberculatus]